jgi:hypothetical protein
MKKISAIITALVIAASIGVVPAFAAFAASANEIAYYDESGNSITVNGLYYNSQGCPMYNANCYYLDSDGNPVYVGGCRAYYYNADGDLTAGSYYYDPNGRAVTHPASYPGGYGRGTWRYGANGDVVSATTCYDDFGNPVDPPDSPPADPAPGYPRGGCCGRRGW